MRDDAELNITELRRKRRESEPASGQPSEKRNGSQRRNGSEREGRNQRQNESRYQQGTWQKRRAPWEDPGEEAPRRALPQPEMEPDDNARLKPEERPIRLPFDIFRILEALKSKAWLWIFAMLALGAAGFFWKFWETKSIASLEFIRREAPVLLRPEAADAFKPQQFTEPTLHGFLKAPEFLKRVAAKSNPRTTPQKIAQGLIINAPENADLVTVVLQANTPPQVTVDLLNLYGNEFIQFTKEMQTRHARDTAAFLTNRLRNVEGELAIINGQMSGFSVEERFLPQDKQVERYLTELGTLNAQIDSARYEIGSQDLKKLQEEKSKLTQLQTSYTDLHPFVQKQKATVEALEKQMTAPKFQANTNAINNPEALTTTIDPNSKGAEQFSSQIESLRKQRDAIQDKLKGLSGKDLNYAMIRTRFQSLESLRNLLTTKLEEVRAFQDSAVGHYSIFTPASMDRASMKSRWRKCIMLGIAGALFGLFSMSGLIVLREILDDRVKTAADLKRVSRMPVLATLGNIKKMSPAEQANWAFRTWTLIKGKIDASPSQGLVCGFISANAGEGRSTWVNLLIETARQRGLRVLTVATRPSDEPAMHPHDAAPDEGEFQERKGTELMTTTLPPSVLAHPATVTDELRSEASQAVVHIPLPGWVWNLERRKQWESALENWQEIENLVMLVELPPISHPEAVLLAEKLPQVIWLCESGKTKTAQVRKHIETLRHAGVKLVGTVLNREPESFFRRQYAKWVTVAVAAFCFGIGSPVQAQVQTPSQSPVPPGKQPPTQFPATAPGAASTPAAGQSTTTAAPNRGELPDQAPLAFSVIGPKQKAQWQQKLTLGPGDILNFGLFGETNFNRNDIPVGPDGRVSYLQAVDVPASGLTIDELRVKIDEQLTKFFRAPRTIITPVSFKSKKYFMLGRIVQKGVFTLDRPLTVLEAVARAQGLETGLLDRNTVDMADLSRSFVIRNGKRLSLNFEKLFYEGDLSQNMPVEPGDYFYFAPGGVREMYVLGEVRTPGVVPFTPDASVVRAIAERGGFTERSFKKRVLVIRGSLNQPETFAVDTLAVLDARQPDFKLQPKDIIYVSKRPFIKVEEIVDIALTAFLQSAATAWVGENVGAIIPRPIIPSIRSND